MRCSAGAAGIAGRGSIRAISLSSWRRPRSAWWRWPRIRWPLGAVTALFGWWLLLTAMLDLEQQWLPDRLTLPLIPLGLAAGLGRLRAAADRAGDRRGGGWAALFLIALALSRRCAGATAWAAAIPSCSARSAPGSASGICPSILLGAGLLGLAALLLMRLRGETVSATTRLPLGTLMILAAWPVWLVAAAIPLLT